MRLKLKQYHTWGKHVWLQTFSSLPSSQSGWLSQTQLRGTQKPEIFDTFYQFLGIKSNKKSTIFDFKVFEQKKLESPVILWWMEMTKFLFEIIFMLNSRWKTLELWTDNEQPLTSKAASTLQWTLKLK